MGKNFEPKAGESVWFVPGDHRSARPRELTVTTVGRKFIHASPHGCGWNITKFHRDSLIEASSYGACGRLYRCEAEYQEECKRQAAWDRLRLSLPHRVPDDVCAESIFKAAGLLGATCFAATKEPTHEQ